MPAAGPASPLSATIIQDPHSLAISSDGLRRRQGKQREREPQQQQQQQQQQQRERHLDSNPPSNLNFDPAATGSSSTANQNITMAGPQQRGDRERSKTSASNSASRRNQGDGISPGPAPQSGTNPFTSSPTSHSTPLPPRRPSIYSAPSPQIAIRKSRAFSLDSRPVAPPTNADELEDDETWEKNVRESNQFSGWHYLPLIFAVVPPAGAIIHGRAEAWSDSLVLIITAFYLYQIVRVPWELYYASRTRRILNTESLTSPTATSTTESPALNSRRRAVLAELHLYELLSLLATVLAPFGGAMLLYWMRFALSDPDRFINPISIRLFVLASGIKPWSHFFTLLRRRSLFLQEEVHYPSSTVVVLQSKIAALEEVIGEIREAVATKGDLLALRDGIDQPLGHLQKALRRSERKEEYARLSGEERFGLLETRLGETLREVAINAELIERLKDENEKATPLRTFLKIVNHMVGQGMGEVEEEEEEGVGGKGRQKRVKAARERKQLRWYEKGPYFYAFLPLNMSTMALGYAGKGVENLSRAVRAADQPALIGNGTGAGSNGASGGLSDEDLLDQESERDYTSGPMAGHTFASKLTSVRSRNR